MIYQHIKKLCGVLLGLYMLLLPIEHSLASDTCKGECVLRSTSDDQNCALKRTPLVRCEKVKEFLQRDSELNAYTKICIPL